MSGQKKGGRHNKLTYNSSQIYARVRDLMQWEPKKVSLKIVGNTVENEQGKVINSYNFKYVFKPSSTNDECFKIIAMPMISNVLKGNNAVLIVYGETGSGKTYSILGKSKLILLCNAYTRIYYNKYISFPTIHLIAQYLTNDQYLNITGILPQILQFMIKEKSVKRIELSSVEVFGHNVDKIYLFDLYDKTNQNKDWSLKKGVSTLEMRKTQNVDITNVQDVHNKIIFAHSASHFAPTGKNPQSSRGHICFITKIYQQTQISYFVVVDCGGSDGKTAFTPEFRARVTPQTLLCRKLEVGTINVGLSQLLVIFNELRRRGKLSKNVGCGLRAVLHPYINTKTCLSVLFTLSPSINNANATAATLQFAVVAGMVKVKPMGTKLFYGIKSLLAKLKTHIEQQEQMINANNNCIQAIGRQQNRCKLAIYGATIKKIQKTRMVKVKREVINDDGEVEYVEEYEEQIYYIDAAEDTQSNGNETTDNSNKHKEKTMEELMNELSDDFKQLVASQKLESDQHGIQVLEIIIEEENEEAMKLALEQYSKLTAPWQKEAFIKRRKAQIAKRKAKLKQEQKSQVLIDEEIDKTQNEFERLQERQKTLEKQLADPDYTPQNEELTEHAIELQIMLAIQESVTESLKQSKQIITDYLKTDGREALVQFFKMKGCIGGGGSSYVASSSTSYRNTIGLSMGGAKDVNNFRKCIEGNIMPSIDSISYNGIFSEYYFDTMTRKHYVKEEKRNCDDGSMLFYPTYCYAKIRKLIFDKNMKKDNNIDDMEYYMTVGLNSNIKQNEFKRKYLNLIILWDKSGSMSSSFDADNRSLDVDINGEWRTRLKVNDKIMVNDAGINSWCNAEIIDVNKRNVKIHYTGYPVQYDEIIHINSNRLAPFGSIKTKMTSAKHAVYSILKQLTVKDRLGIVTFNSDAQILQRFGFLNDINIKELKQNINNVTASGGTNFEKGYKKSMEIYQALFNNDEYQLNSINDEYDHRVIVLTDAQPNEGMSSSDQLLTMIQKYAECIGNRIYTTFIGVGLDFNSSLIDKISSTRGCNYYSVKTTKEFDDKMNEEFEFMVTPLVFNVCLKLKCEGNSCEIEKVYGSNDDKANDIISNGEITKINTLFPSKKSKETGDTKGGIQLIKLKKNKNNNNSDDNINVELKVTFEDRNGKKHKNTQNVTFNPPKKKVNDDMIEIDEKESEEMNINFYDNLGIRKGILLCKYVELIKKWIKVDGNKLNNYSSSTLTMNDEYKKIFTDFMGYFKKEIKECNDDSLQKEVDIMEKLINL